MDNDKDVPVTVLTQITDALELQNKSLADHRKLIELLLRENAETKRRLLKLEATATGSLSSSDEEFLAGITARLAAIASALDAERS